MLTYVFFFSFLENCPGIQKNNCSNKYAPPQETRKPDEQFGALLLTDTLIASPPLHSQYKTNIKHLNYNWNERAEIGF